MMISNNWEKLASLCRFTENHQSLFLLNYILFCFNNLEQEINKQLIFDKKLFICHNNNLAKYKILSTLQLRYLSFLSIEQISTMNFSTLNIIFRFVFEDALYSNECHWFIPILMNRIKRLSHTIDMLHRQFYT